LRDQLVGALPLRGYCLAGHATTRGDTLPIGGGPEQFPRVRGRRLQLVQPRNERGRSLAGRSAGCGVGDLLLIAGSCSLGDGQKRHLAGIPLIRIRSRHALMLVSTQYARDDPRRGPQRRSRQREDVAQQHFDAGRTRADVRAADWHVLGIREQFWWTELVYTDRQSRVKRSKYIY